MPILALIFPMSFPVYKLWVLHLSFQLVFQIVLVQCNFCQSQRIGQWFTNFFLLHLLTYIQIYVIEKIFNFAVQHAVFPILQSSFQTTYSIHFSSLPTKPSMEAFLVASFDMWKLAMVFLYEKLTPLHVQVIFIT